MSRHTSFRLGGPADAFLVPQSPEAAVQILSGARAAGIPLFVLGAGANILVGDRGIRGIVLDCGALRSVRLGRGTGDEAFMTAGAGLSIDELCMEALSRGLGGLEDFYGMPGTVGGAVFMNARCYEREMSQVLERVVSANAAGKLAERGVARGEWSYKRSPWQSGASADGELILEATFRLRRADDREVARVARTMRERRADREAKGHYRLPSAGSVFKNDRALGAPTGKLLDGLGLRGRRVGGALVSPWHANIFVSDGATAAEMRELIEQALAEAEDKLGARLELEVLLVGEF